MVWWGGNPRLDPVVGARSHTQVCDNCNNSAEHTLHRVKTGAGFGNPITGKMWVSTRTEWVMVCVICETGFPVTKEVAQDLQSGRSVTAGSGASGPPKPPLATQISMLQVLHWPHRSACSNCCTGHTDQHAPTAALATRISMLDMHCCSTLKRWSAHNAVAF